MGSWPFHPNSSRRAEMSGDVSPDRSRKHDRAHDNCGVHDTLRRVRASKGDGHLSAGLNRKGDANSLFFSSPTPMVVTIAIVVVTVAAITILPAERSAWSSGNGAGCSTDDSAHRAADQGSTHRAGCSARSLNRRGTGFQNSLTRARRVRFCSSGKSLSSYSQKLVGGTSQRFLVESQPC